MDNRAKILQISMWAIVIVSIVLFVIIIIVGHTNSFNFFFGEAAEQFVFLQDSNVIGKTSSVS
ncbi:MAG TPA: hypothetical protein VK085_06925 [Pseudogracilibacillus sp.]|nr:hypothetical protein [Pseudogracilibacillus sp.]